MTSRPTSTRTSTPTQTRTQTSDAVIWVTHVATDLAPSLDWLATDERARLDGLHIAKRRGDFLLGRWARQVRDRPGRRARHRGVAAPLAGSVISIPIDSVLATPSEIRLRDNQLSPWRGENCRS